MPSSASLLQILGLDILVNCAGGAHSATNTDNSHPEAHADLLRLNTLSVAAAHNSAEDALLLSKVGLGGGSLLRLRWECERTECTICRLGSILLAQHAFLVVCC